MGQFIDRENYGFRCAINSNFIDKSGLLDILNRNMDSENKFMCISRPRRFGKSVAAEMAYARQGCYTGDSRRICGLFAFDVQVSRRKKNVSPRLYDRHFADYQD